MHRYIALTSSNTFLISPELFITLGNVEPVEEEIHNCLKTFLIWQIKHLPVNIIEQ